MIYNFCELAFHQAIRDASSVLSISDESIHRSPLLRGALLLGVGAFDFLMHELIRIVSIQHLANGKPLQLEVSLAEIQIDGIDIEKVVDQIIRRKNAYKSFVSSKNIKDAFKTVQIDIWTEMAKFGGIDSKITTKKLDDIWKWRNRIAHEGDLIPSNLVFKNWPIYSDDVSDAIDFLSVTGDRAIYVLRNIYD
ncbi:HEPN domain-containing protein [Allorhizobium sp. BGMRC 0089]|uniref:HEPN domain-containing protein n=1 Tax=Allorhizobium sonneratiae TaxID=2934936 RepID=UPI0020334F70|nr:HEPN domain-containing protein [Allorhizobium sonneratiae]MCM2293651.1 HEPN domain-containing protein [Allorhizobium sonneratiae]